jgi:hypothetical protein
MQTCAEITSNCKANQSYTSAEANLQPNNKKEVAAAPKVVLPHTQARKLAKNTHDARTLPAQIALPTSKFKQKEKETPKQKQKQKQKQQQKQMQKQKHLLPSPLKNGKMLITPGINTSPLHLDSIGPSDHPAVLLSSKDSSVGMNALSNLFVNPRSKAFLYVAVLTL